MGSRDLLLSGLICLTVILNLWVWFFPGNFINFLRFGKNSKLSNLSIQRLYEETIEKPYYIWMPRIIFTIALALTAGLVYKVWLR